VRFAQRHTAYAADTGDAAHPTCEQGYTGEELAELEAYEQEEAAADGEYEEEAEEAEEEEEEEEGAEWVGAHRCWHSHSPPSPTSCAVVNDSDVSDADLNTPRCRWPRECSATGRVAAPRLRRRTRATSSHPSLGGVARGTRGQQAAALKRIVEFAEDARGDGSG
jgi:hypothetical protein